VKIRILALLVVAAAAGRLNAQETLPAAAPPAGPATPRGAQQPVGPAQWSYAIGLQMGQNFGATKIAIDLESLMAGLRDGMEGKEPKYSPEICSQALQQLGQEQMKAMQEKDKQYLATNAKVQGVQTTPSGLQYKVLRQGNGPTPTKDDKVSVHYRGKLVNGQVFDESYGGQPVSFGVGQVIPGWTEGLQLMKVGDKFELVIPAELGYGARGAGDVIPPNATLIFEVELLGIEGK
jgi:FKBP-type peptidyl-prolyl cis-trans isomerase FklB